MFEYFCSHELFDDENLVQSNEFVCMYKLFLTTNLMTPYDSVPLVGQYWSHLILDLSSSLVNITMVEDLCSQTIRQKSATVSGKGPYKKRRLV